MFSCFLSGIALAASSLAATCILWFMIRLPKVARLVPLENLHMAFWRSTMMQVWYVIFSTLGQPFEGLNFLKFRNLSSSLFIHWMWGETLISHLSASTVLQYLLDLNITGIVSVYSQTLTNIFRLMTACVPLIKEPYSVALLFLTVYCVHILFRKGCSKTDRWDLTSSRIDCIWHVCCRWYCYYTKIWWTCDSTLQTELQHRMKENFKSTVANCN